MPDKALAAHIRKLGDVPQEPDTYRGWKVYQGRWPEPNYLAYSPDYDAWADGEDGWQDNGEKADGATWDAVCAEIDNWFEENGQFGVGA